MIAAIIVGSAAMPAQATESDIGDAILDRVFTEIEREIIGSYYSEELYNDDYQPGRGKKKKKWKNNCGLPPGLAKRDRLPPGLEKQLVQFGELPPGLEKRLLPDCLEDRLGERGFGTERQIVGTSILLVDTATGIILDILRDVVR